MSLSHIISPAVIGRIPNKTCKKVVFPTPLGPINPYIPLFNSRLIFLRIKSPFLVYFLSRLLTLIFMSDFYFLYTL